MIRSFVFDLDGTILNSLDILIKTYSMTINYLGLDISTEQVIQTCLGSRTKNICLNLHIAEKEDLFRSKFNQFYTNEIVNITLSPHITKVLKILKNNDKYLSIVSMGHKDYVNYMLSKFGLLDYFDLIITSDDVYRTKPNQEGLLIILDKLKISPTETLVIGDSENDIKMGRGANCKTILFYPLNYHKIYNYDLKSLKPDKIINDLDQILKYT